MPPRAKPLGKKNAQVKNEPSTKSMAPPANPTALPTILEPELTALSNTLRNAVVKTGQIYGWYADARKLGLQHDPPRSLTASLGREIERYDQLCDNIGSQVLRAITVLQRDLTREEQRMKDAELASISTRTRSRSKSMSPTLTRVALPPVAENATATTETDAAESSSTPAKPHLPQSELSPPNSSQAALGVSARRPSAISLSSLHRPAFPHKLDLSSTALRLTVEEASKFNANGLPSPVTLAPKSARPMEATELPADILAVFAASSGNSNNDSMSIDLTVPDLDSTSNDNNNNGNNSMPQQGGALNMVGNSADRPIDLDLESMDLDVNMSDLFGDDHTSNGVDDGLFTPANERDTFGQAITGDDDDADTKGEDATDDIGMGILDALSAAGMKADAVDSNNDDAIFASFAQNAGSILPDGSADPEGPTTIPNFTTNESATSLLDSLTSSDNPGSAGQPFDLDGLDLSSLSPGFFQTGQDSEMNLEHLLSDMGGGQQQVGEKTTMSADNDSNNIEAPEK